MSATEVNTYITPSRTKVLYTHVTLDGNDAPFEPIWSTHHSYDNIRAEFCLDTGKLISITVIND